MNKEKLIFFWINWSGYSYHGYLRVSVFSKKGNSSRAVDFTVPELVEKDKTKEQYNDRLNKANALQGTTRKTGFIRGRGF